MAALPGRVEGWCIATRVAGGVVPPHQSPATLLPPLSPNLVANEGATQEVAGGTEALHTGEGYLSARLTALGVY